MFGGRAEICEGNVPVVNEEISTEEGESCRRRSYIYHPQGGTFTETGSMLQKMEEPVSVVIQDGRVFAVGADGGAQIYDPPGDGGAGGAWAMVSPPKFARTSSTLTLLPDGRVLLAGGRVDLIGVTESVEIYTPGEPGEPGSWCDAGPLKSARYHHSATSLGFDQSVLLVGGYGSNEEPVEAKSAEGVLSAELYKVGSPCGTGSSRELSFQDPSPGLPLPPARAEHTATLLLDGRDGSRVLLTGGEGTGTPPALILKPRPPPEKTRWVEDQRLNPSERSRTGHTATLLEDGTVLVAGGRNRTAGNEFHQSAEIIHPPTDEQNHISIEELEMPAQSGCEPDPERSCVGRAQHAATRLDNGMVLISGGVDEGGSGFPIASAILYNPESSANLSLPQVAGIDRRKGPSSGGTEVILTGRHLRGATAVCFGERCSSDPPQTLAGGRLKATSPPGTGRVTVSVKRGLVRSADGPIFTYVPVGGGQWSQAAPGSKEAPEQLLQLHAAAPLPSGEVLIGGGVDAGGFAGATSHTSSFIYSPGTDRWRRAPEMTARFGREAHTATPLEDGRVLVAGGAEGINNAQATAELYDVLSNRWSGAGSMRQARFFHSANVLADGRVLVAGGNCSAEVFAVTVRCATASSEIYDPRKNEWREAEPMVFPRAGHSLTRLSDGRVLAAGGQITDEEGTDWAEVFDPRKGDWRIVDRMIHRRAVHTATPVSVAPSSVCIAGCERVLLVGGTRLHPAEVFSTEGLVVRREGAGQPGLPALPPAPELGASPCCEVVTGQITPPADETRAAPGRNRSQGIVSRRTQRQTAATNARKEGPPSFTLETKPTVKENKPIQAEFAVKPPARQVPKREGGTFQLIAGLAAGGALGVITVIGVRALAVRRTARTGRPQGF